VREDSPAAFGAALVGALADPARLLAWGARAQEEAPQRFRFDRQVEAVTDLCARVLVAPGVPTEWLGEAFA